MGALQLSGTTKFHCLCMMESGEELYIAIKAESEAEASRKVHEGYNIEYVLDMYSPLQMEYKKRHLRRSNLTGATLV